MVRRKLVIDYKKLIKIDYKKVHINLRIIKK